jgi:hypothetical protein
MCLAITCTASAVVPLSPAAADGSESQFFSMLNAAREQHGLRPYATADDVTSVARSHSREMASRQSLYHNPNLTTDVRNWQTVGENVGKGPSVNDIQQAFMNSAPHRDNILDHDFTQVGIGVTTDSGGTIWVTEDFRQPMAAPVTHVAVHSSKAHVTAATRPPRHAAPNSLQHRLVVVRRASWARPAPEAVLGAFRYVAVMRALKLGRG